MSDALELAYLAGFFDGEGCVHVGRTKVSPKGRVYYRMMISVSQMDPDPLHLLAARFGGNVTRSKVAWMWQRSGRDASAVLETLLPFLRVKANQAHLAIFYQSMQKGQKRGARPISDVEQAERESFDEAFTAIRHRNQPREGVLINA